MPLPKSKTEKTPNKKKPNLNTQGQPGMKQASLLDFGFSNGLAKQQVVPDKKPEPPLNKPFQHTTTELPKIRKQNMSNYADLSQYRFVSIYFTPDSGVKYMKNGL